MHTFNRIGPHVRQTVNQIGQARQGIKVNPVDNGADRKKADVRQSVIRHFETNCDADIAYLMVADHQVRMGEGYCRVRPEYVQDGPDQTLIIEAVENRFSVYMDPAAKQWVGSDARFAFIVSDLDEDQYTEQYGDVSLHSLSEFAGLGDDAPHWYPNKCIRVAEYFKVKSVWKTINISPKESRRIETRVVCWYKINGLQVLERAELPVAVKWIPIARCVGEVSNIEGKIDYRGIVSDAVEPQKQVNYMESQSTETIAVASKIPYVAAEGQLEDYKAEWEQANRKNYAFLTYKPVTHQGHLVPPPQRTQAGPDIQSMVIASARAENSLRAALGVNDVDAQERRQEQSGKAIVARQRQDELTNGHFGKHHNLMIRHIGRIVSAWAPTIIDAPRTMELVGVDEKSKTVTLYAGQQMAPQQTQEGVEAFDLNVGRFDIVISEGQAYQTRRQEAVDLMTQVFTADPTLLKIGGDILFENMDHPAAQQLGERFKKMLPPELQDQGDEQAQTRKLQQEMQQAKEMIGLLSKELEAKTKVVETDQVKQQAQVEIKKAELAFKAEVERGKAQTDITLKEMDNAKAIRVAEINASIKGYVAEAQHAAQHEAQALNIQAQQVEGDLEREQASVEAEKQRQHEAESQSADLQAQQAQADTDT